MYKITETTRVTIRVNPHNVRLYTHPNMPDGKYVVRAYIDNITLPRAKMSTKSLEN